VPPVTREDFLRAGNRMYPERILHLGQEIDDGVINQIIATMLFMDAEEEKRQTLYINSPGGSVIAGLALYDTMQHVNSPVATVNLGMAASMASFLLGAGERGNRLALPDSRVMIHQPMGGTEGDAVAADPRVEADQVMHIKDTILTLYADMTGKTRADLERDLSYDNYMSSQDAMKYGLVDRIVEG
jgi:ATP-dependent Clp endopeptidase proteolytic subunit ClpP